MRKSKTPLLLITLALALVACGGAGAADSTATPIPTNTPIPLPPESGPSSLDLDDPEIFQEIPNAYTMRVDFRFEGQNADGTDASGAMLLVGANQVEPRALRFEVSVSGAADLGDADTVIYTELDGQIYFWSENNGCANLPANADQDSLFNNFVDTGGFLSETAQRVLPDETINGVPTYHYILGPENLDRSDPDSMDITELTSGSVYVARDGGYVVRLVLQGIGTSNLLSANSGSQGEINYQLDFEPAPNGVTISPPDDCDVSESPQIDYPVLDDASNPTSFGGFYSYQTLKSFDVAVDFYLTSLAEDGWTLEEDNSAGGTAVMLFSMDGRKISVVISPVADGALNVILAEEP